MFFRTAATVFCLFAFAVPSMAQMPCAKHDELVKYLGEKYKEASTGRGIAGERNLVEVYVSEKGSFTIISTYASGTSCIIAAGQNWESMGEPPKDMTAL